MTGIEIYGNLYGMHNKKIVVLGGGTGQFNLLRGLVKLNDPEKITAIAGSWDSGRSSGRLRTEMGILPPGDARQCLVALMEDPAQQEVAISAFNDRSINEHALGNLIIAVLEKIYHGPDRALEKMRKLFKISGKVIPISLVDLELNALLQSGKELKDQYKFQLAFYSIILEKIFIESLIF